MCSATIMNMFEHSHHYDGLPCFDVLAESLTRILSAPIYAEVTGQWMSYIGDFAYLTVAMQHPEDESEGTVVSAAAGLAHY
jgi:secreted PhoX family phosphatase